jgi:serine/threonine protein kinase
MNELTARLSTALADRYAIEREIGAGGMATVYLAEDLKHHRKVAVKVERGTGGQDSFLFSLSVYEKVFWELAPNRLLTVSLRSKAVETCYLSRLKPRSRTDPQLTSCWKLRD